MSINSIEASKSKLVELIENNINWEMLKHLVDLRNHIRLCIDRENSRNLNEIKDESRKLLRMYKLMESITQDEINQKHATLRRQARIEFIHELENNLIEK
ncbi:MAG: hypothetical protein ACOCQD_00790 [archaeon]